MRPGEAGTKGEREMATGRKPLIFKGIEASCERMILSDARAGDGGRTHDSHVGNVALYH